MATLSTIPATASTVIPATLQETYNLWWPYSVIMDASNPGNSQLSIVLKKYYLAADGFTPIYSPLPADTRTITITQLVQVALGTIAPSNVGLSAAGQAALGVLLNGIFNGIKQFGADLSIL